MKAVALLSSLCLLTACGLGETATSAAVGAKTKAAELERAKEVQQKIVGNIDKANQQAAQRLGEVDAK
jgi:hypothetical protein